MRSRRGRSWHSGAFRPYRPAAGGTNDEAGKQVCLWVAHRLGKGFLAVLNNLPARRIRAAVDNRARLSPPAVDNLGSASFLGSQDLQPRLAVVKRHRFPIRNVEHDAFALGFGCERRDVLADWNGRCWRFVLILRLTATANVIGLQGSMARMLHGCRRWRRFGLRHIDSNLTGLLADGTTTTGFGESPVIGRRVGRQNFVDLAFLQLVRFKSLHEALMSFGASLFGDGVYHLFSLLGRRGRRWLIWGRAFSVCPPLPHAVGG